MGSSFQTQLQYLFNLETAQYIQLKSLKTDVHFYLISPTYDKGVLKRIFLVSNLIRIIQHKRINNVLQMNIYYIVKYILEHPSFKLLLE